MEIQVRLNQKVLVLRMIWQILCLPSVNCSYVPERIMESQLFSTLVFLLEAWLPYLVLLLFFFFFFFLTQPLLVPNAVSFLNDIISKSLLKR